MVLDKVLEKRRFLLRTGRAQKKDGNFLKSKHFTNKKSNRQHIMQKLLGKT